MNRNTRSRFRDLESEDADLRYGAFMDIMEATSGPVDWAYEVWDDLLDLLRRGDNHQRAIAAQVLSNLAKSDPKKRMLKDLDALFAVTRDERFVTARHSLQCLWKVAAAGSGLRKAVLGNLSDRFATCATEKNCTLIRFDIIQVFRRTWDEVRDPKIRDGAVALIATEPDAKYRKKYASLWRENGESGRREAPKRGGRPRTRVGA